MTNKELDFLVKLKQKKHREIEACFVIENPKVILEEKNNPNLKQVYVTDNFLASQDNSLPFKYQVISEKELKQVTNSVTPQGMLAIFAIPKIKEFDFKAKTIFVLDNIQDPGNLGTIIRTADWFGFKDLFLGKNCVEIFNPKVVAASMGSLWHLNFYANLELADLLSDLKKNKYHVLATDLKGKEKFILDSAKKIAVIVGNEAQGVSEEVKNEADQLIRLRSFGQAESLNVAVATAILMHEFKR